MAITRAQQARQMYKKGSEPVEQAGVMNYMPSEMVTVPKIAKSSPDTPTAKLAYITPKEQDILIDLNLYGSLDGKPNRGPGGLPSLEGDFGTVKSDGKGGFKGDGKGPDPEPPPAVKAAMAQGKPTSVVTKEDEKRAKEEAKQFFKEKGITTASGGNFLKNIIKARQKNLYNVFPNNPKRELEFLSSLRITNPAKYNTLPQNLKDLLESTDQDFAPSFEDSPKLSFEDFDALTKFDDGAFAQYAKDRGSPGLSVSGDMSKVGIKSIRRDPVTGDPIKDMFGNTLFDYGPPQDGGGGDIVPLYAQLGFPSQAAYLASLSVQAPGTTNQQTTTEDDGLKLRFRAEGGPIGVREDLAEGGMPYEGGIMDLESARQMYGLGKLVKKVTRTVKKIAKSPIGKAALIGAAAFGIPGTSIGGIFGRASVGGFAPGIFGFGGIGNAAIAAKAKLFGSALPPSQDLGKSKGLLDFIGGKAGATIIGASALAGLLTPAQEEEAQALSTGEGIDIDAARKMILQAGTAADKRALTFRAEGGRIGYDEAGAVMSKEEMEKLAKSPLYKGFKKMYNVDPQMAKGNKSYKDKFSTFEQLIKKGYQKGGDVEPVAKKTMPLLDMGGKEMDLREEGGFVPIGRMEKADDVPARLSKNEFVFTADAVRNAGDGDVDKGAEVMYNMMKNLEAGGDVSEESQGLEGARRMFQTSQRLEEVI